jgi:hypothetical protein
VISAACDSATKLQAHFAMRNIAHTVAKALTGIPVLLLIFVLLSASFACAAMAPGLAAPAHPCCPKSHQSDSDHCGKTGCISTVPGLKQASITSAIDSPVAALADSAPVADSFLELIKVSGPPSVEFKLFLRNRQLLI